MLYADPGSGLLIWQLLLAIFLGATFYFSKFRSWISSKSSSERKDDISEAMKEAVTAKEVPTE
jgi:hypothetical protein